MATDVVFSVKISGIEGRDIGPAGSSPDPYFKLDFDHLKEHRSAHKKKTSKPVWEDVIEFEYSTKYAQRLPTKELVVEVWDKRTLTADKMLGEARVPLYALFTGPRRVEIALEDRDHKPAGVLSMVVAVEQTVSIAATVSSLTVDLDDASAAVLDLQLGSTLPALMAQRDEAEASSLPSRVPGGQTYALTRDLRTSRAMLQASAVFGAAIVLTVRGSSELQAFLPIHKYFCYDRPAPFEVDLFPAGADPATSAPVGTASGSLRLHELPEFVQMAGGTLLAGAQPPPGPCIVDGLFLLAEEGVKAPMPGMFSRGGPGSAVITRSKPPAGVTFPQPTNRRAGGGGAAGSSGQRRSIALSSSGPSLAATAAAAAVMGGFGSGGAAVGGAGAGAAVDDDLLRRLAAAGFSSPGSASSGSASPAPAAAAVPPAALMSLQAAVGRAQAALAAAATTEAQLSRAAETRAASQSASDLQLGDLRRAVQESNATLARLSRREAEVERAASAATTAASAWPEASPQAAALADHASRLSTVHGELVELRGTAEKVLTLRDAALTAHLELRAHSDRVAEAEAARHAGLVAAREEAREVIATASGLVSAGGRASTGPSAVGRTEAALDAAAANLSRLMEQHATAAAAEASATQTLVGNRDRVVTSVEQATSALAAAEEHTNANYDAEMETAAAQNLAALADPRAAAAAVASARSSVASARGSVASLSRGGGAASAGTTTVSIPGCWERHIAPDEGRPYFENSMTRSTVWALPTAGEYDVTWPEGSRLGIRLEEQDYPHSDPYAKACVILDADGAAGMGAINAEEMGRGHVLLAACGRPLLGKPLGEVLAVIGGLTASRAGPLSLRFHNPYAVPPAAAAAAANLGVAIVPGPFPAPLPPVRGNPYCAVGAGGAPPPGGPGPAAGGYPPALPAPAGYPSPGGYAAPSPYGAAPAGYGYGAAPGPYGAPAAYGAPAPYGAAPGPAAYGAYPGYGAGGGYGY